MALVASLLWALSVTVTVSLRLLSLLLLQEVDNNSSTIAYFQKKLASWKEIDKTVAGVIHEAQVQRQLFFSFVFFLFFFCLAYTDRLGRIK